MLARNEAADELDTDAVRQEQKGDGDEPHGRRSAASDISARWRSLDSRQTITEPANTLTQESTSKPMRAIEPTAIPAAIRATPRWRSSRW
jgi:hypothetical protein